VPGRIKTDRRALPRPALISARGKSVGGGQDCLHRCRGDIGVHGSIQLAQSLLEAGLVDELRLVVGPAFGFTGRRLFPSTDVRRLELLSATPTPSGSVLLAYRVPRERAS